ncbi:amidohydrolase family protein [Fluoribacter dumoffii]|uniref:Melamine deaminase n=1 Tax=Fluoribacter dumoffii TaxID=463 RepID=A0A377G9J9_9GAMM|nr:amidohydrolase family protein [Fluoribacter dumoffii]KTC90190.1 Melamine deaminase [Fluoribacter dumoffii NY 23]STO21309.1 Melamine deaminase [Fluoribacter dumoffii]
MEKKPILIRNGLLLDRTSPWFMHKVDILIVNDKIKDIGASIEKNDAEIIEAHDMIIMPGLVNAHIHVWQAGLHGVAGNWSLSDYFEKMLDTLGCEFTPEDMYLANLCGALEQLDAGVTCLLDWCNNINGLDYAESALQGLEYSGIRAVFGYGTPGIDAAKWWFNSSEGHPHDAVEFLKKHNSQAEGRIQMGLALRGPDFTTDEVFVSDIQLARDLNVLASMHVGVGLAKFGVKKIHEAGLLDSRINFVHGNNLSLEEYQLIAEHGASLSITPEVEMQMGHGFPATGKFLQAGGEPALGTDIPSNISGNLFAQLRFALQTQRALDNQTILDSGSGVNGIGLSCDKALDWITINSAKALHLDKLIGKIAKDMKADLILIDPKNINLWPVHNPLQSILFYAERHNVDTVIVDGKIAKRQGKLVYPGLNKLKEKLVESSTRIVKNAKLLGNN